MALGTRRGEHAELTLGSTVSPFSDVRRITHRLTRIPVEHDVTVNVFAVCRVGHRAARGRGRDLIRDGRVEVDAPRLRDFRERLRLSAPDSRDGDFHLLGQEALRVIVTKDKHRTPCGVLALCRIEIPTLVPVQTHQSDPRRRGAIVCDDVNDLGVLRIASRKIVILDPLTEGVPVARCGIIKAETRV